MNNRLYQHVTGLLADEGENPTVLAVVAITDPSADYPDKARIIVGSPERSPDHDGYIAKVPGFSASPEAARALGFTLLQAALDVEIATGRVQQRSLEDSFLTTILHDLRTAEAQNAFAAMIGVLENSKRLVTECQARIDKLNAATAEGL